MSDRGPRRPAAPDDSQRRVRRLVIVRIAVVVAVIALASGAYVLVGAVLDRGDDAEMPVDDPVAPAPSEEDTQQIEEAPDEPVPATVGVEQLGLPVLLYGDSGVQRVFGDDRRQLWAGPVALAIPDLRGGIVVHQHADTYDEQLWNFGTIRWLATSDESDDGGSTDGEQAAQVIAHADERAVLHAVAELDGEPTVLFTRRWGELEGELQDNQQERLFGYGLVSGREVDLGPTGALESGLGGVGATDGMVVWAGCHLHCRIERFTADTSTDAGVELERAGPHYGLDVEAGLAGWVTVEPDARQQTVLTLVLHELDNGRRREVELVTLDHRWETTSVTALDLSPDVGAGIVEVVWYDEHRGRYERRTLFVEDLDDGAQVVWLSAQGGVRFDVRSDQL